MKKFLIRGCAIIAILSANALWATTATDDLIKMARSGVDEEVLSAYIDKSPDIYDLSADDIITLKDLGVPSKVIKEALNHGQRHHTSSARPVNRRTGPTCLGAATGPFNVRGRGASARRPEHLIFL